MTESHDRDAAEAAGPHGAVGHRDTPAHGHDDAPGHGHLVGAHPGASLGPVDWQAYGAGLLGVVVGLVITACLILATAPTG